VRIIISIDLRPLQIPSRDVLYSTDAQLVLSNGPFSRVQGLRITDSISTMPLVAVSYRELPRVPVGTKLNNLLSPCPSYLGTKSRCNVFLGTILVCSLGWNNDLRYYIIQFQVEIIVRQSIWIRGSYACTIYLTMRYFCAILNSSKFIIFYLELLLKIFIFIQIFIQNWNYFWNYNSVVFIQKNLTN